MPALAVTFLFIKYLDANKPFMQFDGFYEDLRETKFHFDIFVANVGVYIVHAQWC